jgi:Arc/MetJ-type ribon-helix-helix transcriptional regulator
MRMVTVWIPKGEIEKLDTLINRKFYPSRAEAIRFAIHDLLRIEWKPKNNSNSKSSFPFNEK